MSIAAAVLSVLASGGVVGLWQNWQITLALIKPKPLLFRCSINLGSVAAKVISFLDWLSLAA